MPKIETVLQGFTIASNQGRFGLCSVTLIRGSRNILVDAAHVGRRPVLTQRLAQLGLSPNDIDVVFLTHAHWDHILNIDVFPNAEFLIHPKEREYAKNPHKNDWATPAYTSKVLESYQLKEVKEGDEIDDGVTVIDTPGHTAGSMGLLVKTGDATAAICGDSVHNAWAVRTGQPRLVFWDLEQGKASIRKVLERAQIIYPGHDRPFRPVNGRIQYLEPTNIQIFDFPEAGEDEGLHSMAYSFEPPTTPHALLPE
ncbi:MAG TPA: MBL fold metallo-hydrolase [Dehalococcoidia bacterium]|nr:MBL fold metallo-hydrolase [Dehalococcoidia bacterium]